MEMTLQYQAVVLLRPERVRNDPPPRSPADLQVVEHPKNKTLAAGLILLQGLLLEVGLDQQTDPDQQTDLNQQTDLGQQADQDQQTDLDQPRDQLKKDRLPNNRDQLLEADQPQLLDQLQAIRYKQKNNHTRQMVLVRNYIVFAFFFQLQIFKNQCLKLN